MINFQRGDGLTGMEVANASLLDEATAAAEAMTLLHRVSTKKTRPGERSLFLVSDRCFPQTIEVLRSRAEPLGIDLQVGPIDRAPLDAGAYGALLQFPDEGGLLEDLSPFIASAHEAGVLVAVGADLLSLAIVTPPGRGADSGLGRPAVRGPPRIRRTHRVPCHAEAFVSQMPAESSASRWTSARTAYRMALANRRATHPAREGDLNICTARRCGQLAAMYAVYHGPTDAAIASRVH